MRDLPSRMSLRLPDFNYASNNWYFVTICANNRRNLFVGADYYPPVNTELNAIGQIVQQYWQEIPDHYPFVTLDQFVVMPNHIHGIITIDRGIRADNNPPLHHIVTGTIGAIVRGFKIGVTKLCRQNTNVNNVWQRNYYEHIIRDEHDLDRIRIYIHNNPFNWINDRLHNP